MESASPVNNQRLCELIQTSGVSEAVAITLFNRGRRQPVTHSEFRAWTAAPFSSRWKPLSDDELEHAERIFGVAKVN